MDSGDVVAIAAPMQIYQTVTAVIDPSQPEPASCVGLYINIFSEPLGQI
jgi:hypothetical protein